MRRVLPALAGIGLLFSGAALAAQPDPEAEPSGQLDPVEAPVTPEDAIIVTGKRLEDKEVSRFIYDMLRPLSIGQETQYPRLKKPFCPSAIGFTEAAEELIEARMRKVAAAAGIAVAQDDKCRPNMHLVRVEDGPEMIRYLRTKAARSAFGLMPPHLINTIERRKGPVFSWQQMLQYGADTGQAIAPNLVNAGPGDPATLGINYIYSNPRLRMGANSLFRHATVLVEREALDNVSAIQLADFAVMRGLVPAREDEYRRTARSKDSILNLFDPALEPDDRLPSLGRTDLALLTALYAAPENVNASRQRGRMVNTFRTVLDELE